MIDIATFSPTLATLIGLGVGIDYSLFVVTRHRNAIIAGRDPEAACVRALNTSGRAVLFAGATVIVALLGLLVLGVSFLNGVASRLRDRRAHHDDRGRHADPGTARDVRHARALAQGAPAARGGGSARPEARRLLAALGEDRAAAPRAARGRRAGRHARARRAGPVAAAGVLRRRAGPGLQDHPQGVRPAGQGLRAGLQRHLPDRREDTERQGGPAEGAAARRHARQDGRARRGEPARPEPERQDRADRGAPRDRAAGRRDQPADRHAARRRRPEAPRAGCPSTSAGSRRSSTTSPGC